MSSRCGGCCAQTATPTTSALTTVTAATALHRLRRRAAGDGAPNASLCQARNGTGSLGRPAASSSTHCGTRPDGDFGTSGGRSIGSCR